MMKQMMCKSRLEVWEAQYINSPENREEKDRKAEIVQMEYATTYDGDVLFMVEVVDDG